MHKQKARLAQRLFGTRLTGQADDREKILAADQVLPISADFSAQSADRQRQAGHKREDNDVPP